MTNLPERKSQETKATMGRPPCCDKVGVKKGPWTPEEDIILVSYIQEHGPGNWRATIPRGQWERRLQTDIHMAKQALRDALSPEEPSSLVNDAKPSCGMAKSGSGTLYASSTENIARLLKGWMRNGPKQSQANSVTTQNSFNNMAGADSMSTQGTPSNDQAEKNDLHDQLSSDAFESLFGFESFDSSNSELSQSMSPEAGLLQEESKPNSSAQVPLSMLEKWLFDEGTILGKDYLSAVTLDDNGLF
ncbi:hypothetical protein Tsubulata_009775 [Turnera subulata]|uniref:Myb-like domain-containing protein n=1 Tax=Turnera subulata TaxID=218843 RepID=A0A9Q0J0V3_9ROSI|nr:hypothetical protein Tsubulata_009775 [Turnera subulata]